MCYIKGLLDQEIGIRKKMQVLSSITKENFNHQTIDTKS